MLDALSFLTEHSSDSNLQIGINTSGLFDMITGTWIKGKDGVWYLNGGLMPINAVAGGNNTQKTGRVVDDLATLLYRFIKSIVIFQDVESTLDISRLARKVDSLFGIPGYFAEHIEDKRFIYKSNANGDDGTKIHDLVIEMYIKITGLRDSKDKEDQRKYKELFIKTPFWSKKKNAHIEMMNPILLVVDGMGEINFDNLMFKQFDEGEMDAGGKKRTRDMEIGNLRRILMSDVCTLGPRIGLRSYWTAQTGKIISIDGKPQEKESVFIRPGVKLKAPKAMMQLPHIGIEIIKGTVMKQPDGSITYPNPKDSTFSNDAKKNPDLILYQTSVFRNKSGGSGGDITFIGCKDEGIDHPLSMYENIKDDNYFGLTGNNVRHSCALYPDVTLMRTTVRSQLKEDARLRRAIEFTYQLWEMQTFDSNTPKEFLISPETLYTLVKEQGHDWNEILDTIGFWHDNHEFIKAPILTTMELLEVAVNKKPLHWKNKDKK